MSEAGPFIFVFSLAMAIGEAGLARSPRYRPPEAPPPLVRVTKEQGPLHVPDAFLPTRPAPEMIHKAPSPAEQATRPAPQEPLNPIEKSGPDTGPYELPVFASEHLAQPEKLRDPHYLLRFIETWTEEQPDMDLPVTEKIAWHLRHREILSFAVDQLSGEASNRLAEQQITNLLRARQEGVPSLEALTSLMYQRLVVDVRERVRLEAAAAKEYAADELARFEATRPSLLDAVAQELPVEARPLVALVQYVENEDLPVKQQRSQIVARLLNRDWPGLKTFFKASSFPAETVEAFCEEIDAIELFEAQRHTQLEALQDAVLRPASPERRAELTERKGIQEAFREGKIVAWHPMTIRHLNGVVEEVQNAFRPYLVTLEHNGERFKAVVKFAASDRVVRKDVVVGEGPERNAITGALRLWLADAIEDETLWRQAIDTVPVSVARFVEVPDPQDSTRTYQAWAEVTEFLEDVQPLSPDVLEATEIEPIVEFMALVETLYAATDGADRNYLTRLAPGSGRLIGVVRIDGSADFSPRGRLSSVAAYTIANTPMSESARRFILRVLERSAGLREQITTACHALGLDEERRTSLVDHVASTLEQWSKQLNASDAPRHPPYPDPGWARRDFHPLFLTHHKTPRSS